MVVTNFDLHHSIPKLAVKTWQLVVRSAALIALQVLFIDSVPAIGSGVQDNQVYDFNFSGTKYVGGQFQYSSIAGSPGLSRTIENPNPLKGSLKIDAVHGTTYLNLRREINAKWSETVTQTKSVGVFPLIKTYTTVLTVDFEINKALVQFDSGPSIPVFYADRIYNSFFNLNPADIPLKWKYTLVEDGQQLASGFGTSTLTLQGEVSVGVEMGNYPDSVQIEVGPHTCKPKEALLFDVNPPHGDPWKIMCPSLNAWYTGFVPFKNNSLLVGLSGFGVEFLSESSTTAPKDQSVEANLASGGTERYYSKTDSADGPFYGQPVIFTGHAGYNREMLGGSHIVYRMRITFDKEVYLKSFTEVAIGDQSPPSFVRVLDSNKVERIRRAISGFNVRVTNSVAIGLRGTVFYIDEFDRSASWRYRETMKLDFSPTSDLVPEISEAPKSFQGAVGDAWNLAVTASGATGFQWLKDGLVLSGSTNSTFKIDNIQNSAIGDYRVVVGNSVGSVTSSVATLTLSGVNASAWKGLIAQYRLDGSGADASLFGHEGTNRGGLRFGVDRFGQTNAALAFNGFSSSYEDEDRCDVGTLSPDALNSMTFMGWVRLASKKDSHTLFSSGDGSGLYLNKDGISYRWYPQNLETKVSTTLGLNRWYHVAAAFNGNTVSFYVDGQKVGSTTATAGYPGVPLQGVNLGARGYGNVYYTLNGALDDVRFYNRELAASDVLEIFNSEKPGATQGALGEFRGYGVYKAGVAVDSAALMQSVPQNLTQVAQITGFRHPLVLKSDGSVVSWGGPGSLPASMRKAVKVSAGENTDVVLHDDGTVSFSSNFEAPETSRALLKGIVDIAANWDRVSFLNSEGQVFTFFYNNVLTNIPYSGEVVGLWRSADYGHVLQADGTVKDWDEMSAVRSHTQPLEKLGITDFVQIDGGFGLTRGGVLKPLNVPGIAELQFSFNYPLAIKTDGSLYEQLDGFFGAYGEAGASEFAKSLQGVVAAHAGWGWFGASVSVTPKPRIASELKLKGLVGEAFRYQIPVTGQATEYSAIGLPAGLTLDAKSGVISGTVSSAYQGRWRLTASGPGGLDGRVVSVEFVPSYPVSLEVVNGSIQSGAGGFVFTMPSDGSYGRAWQEGVSLTAGIYTTEIIVDGPFSIPASSYFPEFYGGLFRNDGNLEYLSRHVKTDLPGNTQRFATRVRVLADGVADYGLAMVNNPQVTIRSIRMVREADGVQVLQDPNLTGVGGFWKGRADFASAIGRIQATPSQSVYQSGSTVTLKAVPTRAFAFSQWTINGVLAGSANPLTLTVDAAKAVKAEFKAVRFLASATQGAGRVDRSVVADTYADGSVIMLTAVPEKGWEFVGWTGSANGAQPQINLTLSQDQAVTAKFRPVFAPVAAQAVEERQTWQLKLLAGDPSVVGRKLTYRLISGPVGPTLDTSTGTLTWTPGEADGGKTYDFQVAATDTADASVENQISFRLSVAKVNNPPTLGSVANATIPESAAWSIALAGQDLDLPVQVLTYSLVSGPSGMSVDSATGGIRWTPTEAQGPGTYPVTVRVTDPDGLFAERSFTVAVTEANAAPVFAAIPDQTTVFGKSVQLQLSATDSDEPANTLTYRWVSGPTNMTVSASGQLTWTPLRAQVPSSQTVTVAVSDGTASVSQTFRIEALDLITSINGAETTNTVSILPPAKIGFRVGRADWLIFYSVDGTEPTASSLFYLDAFNLSMSATVWPIAYSPDFSQSVVGLPIRVNLLKAQTLTVVGGNGLIHQGSGVAVTGASDSGLPVTLSVISGPARLENGLLIPTGGGTVRLRASQGGNADWAPANVEIERVVAKAAQSLTWTPLPEVTFGAAPITLKATASSGLQVTYQVVSGEGVLNADRLTLTAAGDLNLRATQAGSADFEAATADVTLRVKKATQSLTFGGIADRELSTTPIPLVANASSGLPVGFEVLSGPAKVTGNQLTLTGLGTVVLRATQPGNSNYEAALPKDQQFAVTKGAQTLTFNPVGAKTFGDAPVNLVASSSANLPITFRVLSGPGTLNGDVLTLTGAGDIVVQAVQAGNDWYQAASVSQTIKVGKAAQTVTFANLPNVPYSTNAVVLDGKASSGLPVTYRVISGAGSIVANRLTLVGLGSIAVAADQEGNANWLAATSVTNTFTVSRGVQTIAFAPIGDQLLSAGSVTLNATSSAGLPVVFTVMSGAATISGGKLQLLNEGSVTVRALNPGSPLWLAAQIDQTFQVRKLVSLTVHVAGNLGGTVAVSPAKDQYAPTDSVTLTATAASGFAFSGWSGDLTGAANPASLTMSANRSVTATFKDTQPPAIAWDLPAAGTTGVEQVRLSGTVTDNSGAATALWSRDGAAEQALSVGANGGFSVENLVLNAGTNRFALVARDAAGNETRSERLVVWVPQRVLQVADAVQVQEGQRVVFPVSLSSGGDVAGLTFELKYDATYLTDPQVEWGALVGQSVNNVNIATPGEISATFSMAGSALPAGSQRLATVSFRARSVPAAMQVTLEPRWVSGSSSTGALLANGNAVQAGSGRIVPRRIKGDNNANQRIDIGDAVLISRLQVKLEEVRNWDIALNDLNGSGAIDNGDVVRALRAVVGLDPQPTPGSEAKRRSNSLNLADSLGLPKVLVNTNDVMALELIDGPTATVGQSYRVAVRLNRVKGSLSGLSFTVKYPASLSLTDKQVGALVPGDALPFWNEGAGQVSLAAIRSTAWANATGVAAVLTFVPSAAFSSQAEWPLRLEQSEITGSGFDVRPVDPVTAIILSGGGTVDNRPQITLEPPKADGTLGLEIRAPQGATVAVETTSDLSAWTESQRITGQGTGTPVKVTLQSDPNVQAKFWRVRMK